MASTDELIFHLDLSVVAYQVYNQSLIFPLDPWYERWARPGSDRRTNIMAALHEADRRFWGPGANAGRRWPTNPDLDPILSAYDRIDPNRSTVTYDGEAYRLFTPAPVAASLGRCYVADYDADRSPRVWPVPASRSPREDLATSDVIYAFEGATGGVKAKPPAWSLMGVIIARTIDENGGYDVHIAFRGSQSGWAVRAALWGFILESGNPDWVTDMEAIRTVSDPRISTDGEVVEGLRNAVIDSIDSIGAALGHIAAERRTKPRSITIAGHSLGGALAIQLAAALTIGQACDRLPAPVRDWPWPALRLFTFGAPKALDGEAAASFDKTVDTERVWLDGDPITAGPIHAHVGRANELSLEGVSGGDAHRPSEIRRALSGVAGGQWHDHESLIEALEHADELGQRPSELYVGDPDHDLDLLIEAGATSIGAPSSYLIGLTKSNTELAARQSQLREVFASGVDSIADLMKRTELIAGIQPGSALEAHIQELLVMREVRRNDWTLDQIEHLVV